MSLSKPKHENLCKKIARKYAKLLQDRPVLTKAITSAVTAGLGNLFSQLLSGQGQEAINWRTVGAFSTTGLVFVGPVIHYYLIWLDLIFPRHQKYAYIKRMLIDRLLFAPPFMLIYFYLLALLEGQSSIEATIRIYQLFWPTLKMNWKFWTPLQFININYIPQQYRLLFANIGSLGWTVYAANKARD